MGFKKGKPKTGGRAKGVTNKKTQQWEELSGFLLNEGADKFIKELKKLKGKEFCDQYNKTLEYFKPKLSRTQGFSSNINYDISDWPVEWLRKIAECDSEEGMLKIIAEYESIKNQS